MEISLVISNRQRSKPVNRRLLKQIVAALLAGLKVTEAEIGIQLVGKTEMARVNQQFLQHEGSTDVITFDHGSRKPSSAPGKAPLHGELFVCVDDAIAQAKEFGTTWQSEIIRYVVHGVLHLLGYDDLKPALRRTMKREENKHLRALTAKFSLAQIGRRTKIST
jgi:rRNA maturation RNase YbeY